MMIDAETRPTLNKPAMIKFPVVTKIVEAIRAQPLRDRAMGEVAAAYIVKSMAEENGFPAFQTPEERAVSSALQQLSCGPRSAHYGWRLYRRYRQGGDIAVDAVRY